MDTVETRRHRARDRFLTIWGVGFALGLGLELVDPARAVGVTLAVLWYVAAALTGGAWLRLALGDGSLARALPDYLHAGLALAVVATSCAAVALLVLLALGDEITAPGVTGWAAIGTVAVLVTYWSRRAWRPPRARPRRR